MPFTTISAGLDSGWHNENSSLNTAASLNLYLSLDKDLDSNV